MAKKPKRKKLHPLPKIRRRLLKLWAEKVRMICGDKCAVCGMPNGTVVNEKPQKLDSHHIESRINPSLRFDIMNGISLDVWHHKFGRDSFHRSAVFSMDWLMKNRPKQYEYIMVHRNDVLDLDDRSVLAAIEEKLKAPPTPEEIEILSCKVVWDGKLPQTSDGDDGDEGSGSESDLFTSSDETPAAS